VIREYRPGNIAPEDFVDRMLREIGDPKKESDFERVVFDDVSQLGQRFPLLAASKLFVPTLIDMFKATGITSLFLADTEGNDHMREDAGMAIMADQVIRTSIQYLSAKGEPQQRGRYSQREVIVDVESLPGDDRHLPHVLRFSYGPSRFLSDEEEASVTLDALPIARSGGLATSTPS
jgi:hypothetical protein